MNPQLHHLWNATRDYARGSNKEGDPIPDKVVKENTLTLKEHNRSSHDRPV